MFGKYIPGQVVEYRMEHWHPDKTMVGTIDSGPFADGMWMAYEIDYASGSAVIREYEIIRVLVGVE